MSLLILRVQDANTTPSGRSLLEGAKLAALHQAARGGAVGLLKSARRWPAAARSSSAAASDPMSAHGAWLGASSASARPNSFSPIGPGRCYAAGMNAALGPDDIAWCCELVTQHEGRLLDPTAGAIRTAEAAPLIDALNAHCGNAQRRWIVGEGSHHLLVTPRAALEGILGRPGRLEPPEGLVGRLWRRHLPRLALGAWVRRLLEETAPVLERHEINKVRVDLGENPANLPWLWGPAASQPVVPFQPVPGWRGVLAGEGLLLKGYAALLGLRWLEAPPAAADLQAFGRRLQDSLADSDLVYVVLRISSSDPVERQCIMDRVDQQLVQPVLDTVGRSEHRGLFAIDDAATGTAPVVLVGRGVVPGAAARVTVQDAAATSFRDVPALMRWAALSAPRSGVPAMAPQSQAA
ncbi:MAG: hypothetical protein HYY15_04365 [Candidatus Omnitrophica bacterium]|nr:hypothetical protein [Candidatus Omnitrophota bacterium]